MSSVRDLPLVFVCGHRKSGTTMLANLLDGHPKLATYPIDLALLYAYFPEFMRAHRDPGELRARLATVLFADLRKRVEPNLFDVDWLEREFFEDLPDDALQRPDILINRLMAAFRTVRKADAQQWGVFKETSVEIYAQEILDWFPDARFIHLLRDPRDNFAALAAGVDRYYSRLGESHKRTLASLLNRVDLGFRMARANREQLGSSRYHLLRFEDLTASPEQSMQEIAGFLGIEMLPSLLTPTMLGHPSGGNAFDGAETFAVSPRNVGRWRDRITSEDAQVIEFHLAREMQAFGYEPDSDGRAQVRAAAEFYKWQNYTYFYSDRFAQGVSR
jgi:hypothetical protein